MRPVALGGLDGERGLREGLREIERASHQLEVGGLPTKMERPSADRIAFWDTSAEAFNFLGLGTGLAITDTTLAYTIQPDSVTYAMLQNVSATDRVLGRSSSGAGDVEEIVCTAAGRALIDDAAASNQRTTLGLEIGSDVQAYDADTAKTDVAQTWTAAQKNTAQPAFLAYPSADIVDVTGDNTSYTVIFDTEVFDQASNYNNATGVFTAPISGRYQLNACVTLSGVLAAHTRYRLSIFTSNRIYHLDVGDTPIDVNNRIGGTLSVLADMDANDTARVDILVAGSTKVVDVVAGSDPFSTFSGFLAC